MKKVPVLRKKLYEVWYNILFRCNNPHCNQYRNYGGRGIKMCKEWAENFLAFYTWALESGYSEGLTIDRINVDGDYSPDNCRWITNKEQQSNKRNTIYIHFHGTKIPLMSLIDKFGLIYGEVFDFMLRQERLRK